MNALKKIKSIPQPESHNQSSSLRKSLIEQQFGLFGRKDSYDHDLIQMYEWIQPSLPKPDAILNHTLQESTLRDSVISECLDTNRSFSRVNPKEQPVNNIITNERQNLQISRKESSRSRRKNVQPVYRNHSYPYCDLALTFYNMRTPPKVIVPLYLTSLIVRAYTICYLLFVLWLGLKDGKFIRWEWIVVIAISRILFIILVFRVSLSMADGIVDTVLKNVWNHRDTNLQEIFERITFPIVIRTTRKALTPPELSFLYLFKENKKRRTQVYYLINFVYISIETVVFYPFVIGYSFFVLKDQQDLLTFAIFNLVTIVVATAWIFLFVLGSIMLFLRGWRISREHVE